MKPTPCLFRNVSISVACLSGASRHLPDHVVRPFPLLVYILDEYIKQSTYLRGEMSNKRMMRLIFLVENTASPPPPSPPLSLPMNSVSVSLQDSKPRKYTVNNVADVNTLIFFPTRLYSDVFHATLHICCCHRIDSFNPRYATGCQAVDAMFQIFLSESGSRVCLENEPHPLPLGCEASVFKPDPSGFAAPFNSN